LLVDSVESMMMHGLANPRFNEHRYRYCNDEKQPVTCNRLDGLI